jgi:hypothetical protein
MRRETDGMRHGRHALRRQWKHLRALAASCATQVSDKEVIALLGKTLESLDPEMNDLKALVAYCVGKGFTDGESLIAALQKDLAAEPMAFLAQHSGKSFGEKWGPAIAKYWLCGPSDRWVKKKAKDFYDIEWIPVEAGVGIRIELKASSEAPAFRFQQVRHPRLGELNSGYDILLCLGVTASSLEWWVIPTDHLDSITNNGSTPPDRIVIRKHHGKDAPIWNDAKGYGDEGWFCTDARCRLLLQSYLASNEGLRDAVLRTYGGQTT